MARHADTDRISHVKHCSCVYLKFPEQFSACIAWSPFCTGTQSGGMLLYIRMHSMIPLLRWNPVREYAIVSRQQPAAFASWSAAHFSLSDVADPVSSDPYCWCILTKHYSLMMQYCSCSPAHRGISVVTWHITFPNKSCICLMDLPQMPWPMIKWQSITARSAVLSLDYNVVNVNLVEYPIECILRVLGGRPCLELQVSNTWGCCSPLPSLFEVDWIRHLVKNSCKCVLCFISNFFGCFWD
jgi:hypothetical protein